jgi:uncharacterized protein YkwD
MAFFVVGCSSSPSVFYDPPEKELYVASLNAARAAPHTCQKDSTSETIGPSPGLSWNGLLAEAARQRAQYMLDNNLSLDDPNIHREPGDTQPFVTRAVKNGMAATGSFGENAAINFGDPDPLVSAWLSSTNGHCNNLMDPSYTQMGLAKVGEYWVLILHGD